LDVKVSLLIVDDEPSIRFSLCEIFRSMGHSADSAEDGFSALHLLNTSLPDILLSDLYMPHMSGFELLSVVRRRFPSVYTIGMTGAFIDRMPVGIAADAFYRKASGIPLLLDLIAHGAASDRLSVWASRQAAPIWVPPAESAGHGSSPVMLGCPACLRAFVEIAVEQGKPQETHCAHCSAPLQFAVVEQYA
jgi:CheY-like chemotaxis protein